MDGAEVLATRKDRRELVVARDISYLLPAFRARLIKSRGCTEGLLGVFE
jgi:hypothetical protein